MIPTKPILFAVIKGIRIEGNLGRGDRIANSIFITNDAATKRSIVTAFFERLLGQLEYDSIFEEPQLLAYAMPGSVPEGEERNTVRGFLLELSHFEKTAWLQRDHAICHGNGYLWANDTIWQNSLDGTLWRADGSKDEIKLTREKLKELRKHNVSHDWTPITREQIVFTPSREKSSRLLRAVHYVFNAQCSSNCADKITNYCSALEALAATSRGELVHQLSERTAVMASDDHEQRLVIYRKIKKCYGLRSEYSHGSAIRQRDLAVIDNHSFELDEIVRICINRVLRDETLHKAIQSDATLEEWFLKRLFS